MDTGMDMEQQESDNHSHNIARAPVVLKTRIAARV
jgi:hypothetical protein